MSQAVLDISSGIYGALAADTGTDGVATLATGGIFQAEVTQDTLTPYVVHSQHTSVVEYTLKRLAVDDILWLVKAVCAGEFPLDTGRTIMARVDTILTDQAITVSAGKVLLYLRRETDIPPYRDDDPETGQVFFHVGALYRVQVANA